MIRAEGRGKQVYYTIIVIGDYGNIESRALTFAKVNKSLSALSVQPLTMPIYMKYFQMDSHTISDIPVIR